MHERKSLKSIEKLETHTRDFVGSTSKMFSLFAFREQNAKGGVNKYRAFQVSFILEFHQKTLVRLYKSLSRQLYDIMIRMEKNPVFNDNN